MRQSGKLKLIKAGSLTTLQDLGRRGAQHLGICQSGAADDYGFYWANQLLNNPKNSPCLEISLGNFSATFTADSVIALSGAEMNAKLNGNSIKNWCLHRVFRGDTIHFNYAKNGLLAYLAVKGGFCVAEKMLGSISSVPREQLGFNRGQALSSGQELAYFEYPNNAYILRELSRQYIPSYSGTLSLNIYPSYQFSDFSKQQREQLTRSEYLIDQASNKMGYRLSGEEITYQGKQIYSEGIALGAVQVPPNGQPIILLKDRQTIGGYPKIGCIARKDCAKLAQRKPGDKVRFKWQELPEH